MFLNSILLFVVLFYVYPLKFLTAALIGQALGLSGPRIGSEANSTLLMVLYGGGVVLIFGLFWLLYRHARRQATWSTDDELVLKFGQRAHLVSLGIGVLSIVVALVWAAPVAGLIYILMGPLHAWNGVAAGRARAAAAADA